MGEGSEGAAARPKVKWFCKDDEGGMRPMIHHVGLVGCLAMEILVTEREVLKSGLRAGIGAAELVSAGEQMLAQLIASERSLSDEVGERPEAEAIRTLLKPLDELLLNATGDPGDVSPQHNPDKVREASARIAIAAHLAQTLTA